MDIKNYYFRVKNRSAGVVVYTIPEANITRRFAPGETKRIPYNEILQLSYQPGGREMLISFLQVDSTGVLNTLGIQPQPEYNMSEAQIKELLLNGDYNAFLDCLDFAPTGVIDLVKKFAVELPLSDLNKRKALKAKTGFDVDKAIENSGKEPDPKEEEQMKAAVSTPTSGRRTNVDYKIVDKK